MKTILAAINSGFRPQMSEHLGHKGVNAVLAKVYELYTHVYWAAEAFKFLVISGRAVAIIVRLSAEKNWAEYN